MEESGDEELDALRKEVEKEEEDARRTACEAERVAMDVRILEQRTRVVEKVVAESVAKRQKREDDLKARREAARKGSSEAAAKLQNAAELRNKAALEAVVLGEKATPAAKAAIANLLLGNK